MMINTFQQDKNKSFIFSRGKYDVYVNHLLPPELLIGPLKACVVPLSSPSFRNKVSMIITVYKMLWIQAKNYKSHLETPELHLGPL